MVGVHKIFGHDQMLHVFVLPLELDASIIQSIGNSHLRSNEGDAVSSALSPHQPPLPLALALVSDDATPTLIPPPHPTWLFISTSAATT